MRDLDIIALLIWRPWSREKSELIPSEKPSLAIMYFKNNTGDESLDHWRTMITDLFIADLTQSKYINVLSGERLFQLLSDLNQLEAHSYSPSVLKHTAELSGVSHLLLGNYAKAGETIRINGSFKKLRQKGSWYQREWRAKGSKVFSHWWMS